MLKPGTPGESANRRFCESIQAEMPPSSQRHPSPLPSTPLTLPATARGTSTQTPILQARLLRNLIQAGTQRQWLTLLVTLPRGWRLTAPEIFTLLFRTGIVSLAPVELAVC